MLIKKSELIFMEVGSLFFGAYQGSFEVFLKNLPKGLTNAVEAVKLTIDEFNDFN